MHELLFGKVQNNSAREDLGRDNDGFIDIDELLPGTPQKSMPLAANPTLGSIAEKIDKENQSDNPVGSSYLTAGSSQDLVILSDDESMAVESKTDDGSLDVIIKDGKSTRTDVKDEIKAKSVDIAFGNVERDSSLHGSLPTQDPVTDMEPVNSSCHDLRDDLEAGCYIDEESPLSFEPNEQEGSVPSPPAPDCSYSLNASPLPSSRQINQSNEVRITQSESEELVVSSFGQQGDEAGPALVEQAEPSLASAPNFAHPPSFVEASQERRQGLKRSETANSKLERLQSPSLPSTLAQGREEGEQRETRMVAMPLERSLHEGELVGDVGGVEVRQEGFAGRKVELRRPAEVDKAVDPKEATRLGIENRRFRLRGIRRWQLARAQAETI
jgi:hypothetical protein